MPISSLSRYYSCFLIALLLSIASITEIKAQPRKGEFIEASIGLGITGSYSNVDIGGEGFFIQGEYVYAPKTWFSMRPYLGFITTSGEDEVESGRDTFVGKATTTALLVGGKIRLTAPIPYFAPYLESGFGASIGKFETKTGGRNIDKSGVITHIPFTIGVALGKRNTVEVEFTYYFMNEVQQFAGAAAVGLSFPINSPKN